MSRKLEFDDALQSAIPEFTICEGKAICSRLMFGLHALPELRVGAEVKINGDWYAVTKRIDDLKGCRSIVHVKPKEAPPEWAETHQGS